MERHLGEIAVYRQGPCGRERRSVTYLKLVMLVFALAAGVNTASVALQQRHHILTHIFGPRAWYAHLALIIPPWLWFLAALGGLNRRIHWPLPDTIRMLGSPVRAVAAALWLLAFWQLGPVRTVNGSFFNRGPAEPVRGGIYRWLQNPMYDSYVLAFVGTGLHHANAVYLLLAAESYLLLNRFEAQVENRPFVARRS